MKKNITASFVFIGIFSIAFSQNKYFTRTATISFHSHTPLESIEAVNKQVTCILNTATGEINFQVQIKSFEFEKALMQEHFNENYMHSDQHPKSTFDGKIVDISAVDFTKDGIYAVKVNGKLTIHGVTMEVTEFGNIIIRKGEIMFKSSFLVALKDYNIKNDKQKNIANDIEVTVDTKLAPFKKE